MSSTREVWIGLVEVSGRPGSHVLEATKGAYSNALAVADDLHTFTQRVMGALAELAVDLVMIEDAGRFPREFRVPKENQESLRAAAAEALSTGNVQFTTWHVFVRDQADKDGSH